MSERLSKGSRKYKRNNSNNRIIQLSELKLEELIDNKIKTAISPLEEEMKELKSNLKEICASQSFISDKHNEVANEYKTVLVNNKKQKKQIIKLNERADDLQKKIKNEKLKLDELDQYSTIADKISNLLKYRYATTKTSTK